MFVKYALIASYLTPGVDFPKHRLAAIDVLAGRNPYSGANYLGFNYPLLTAWIYVFLAWIPAARAETVWDLCNAFYVAATLFVVARFFRPAFLGQGESLSSLSSGARAWIAGHWPSFSALILAFFAPVFLEIHDGNVEPLNLALIAVLCAFLLRGRQTAAGIVLAVLCLIKILPVYFVPILLLAGKRRTVFVWASAMILYGAVLLFTGWWRWEWFLYSRVLPNVGFRYVGDSNSLARIAREYLAPTLLESKPAYDVCATAISLAVSAAFFAVLWFARRAMRESWRQGVAFASLTVVLVTPLLEYQHLIWCLPAYLFLFLDWIEGRIGGRFFTLGLVLWASIVCARYVSDLGGPRAFNPLHFSTLLAAALWVATGARFLLFPRPADTASSEIARAVRA